MKLTFIRHAETDYNHQNRLALDSEPLNEGGLKQARKLAKELTGKFDVIFSSPFRRTMQTAEIISKELGLEIVVDNLLKDKSYGSLSGKSLEEAQKEKDKNPELRDPKLGYNYEKWGGESGDQVKTRLLKFVEKIKNNYPGKNVLVITHGAIIRLMHILFSRREYSENFPIPNASIHEFDL